METDWLGGRARITPSRPAVKDSETNEYWTFGQLNTRAIHLASYLIRNGINKGDRVALIAPNHVSYFDFLFACTKIGAIFVPINWRLSNYEIEKILIDCNPKFIGFTADKEDSIKCSGISKVDIESYEYEIVMKHPFVYQSFNKVFEQDPIAILYTSGSTGNPKGVLISHRTLLANGYNTILSWHLKATDSTITCTPMFHTAGLFALTIPILMIGGKVTIVRRFEPETVIQLINSEGCTHLFMVPTMYHVLIQAPLFSVASFPSMDVFISGGSPCPRGIYKAFNKKGLRFKEAYGMTEAGPNNFYIEPLTAMKKIGSVGKPMLFNEVKIVNEHGKESEPDEIGEIVITGNHVFDAYWNNPDETKKVLKDKYFFTGDLGKRDKEGYFYIVGRKNELIISGGENIYPTEIENVINEHPAVNETAVVGLVDEKWGEIVVAMISLNSSSVLNEDELKIYCRSMLAGYKIPRKIYFVEMLPKNHAGKIDKKKIVEMCGKLYSLHVS